MINRVYAIACKQFKENFGNTVMRFLVIRRPNEGTFPGWWEFPHMEDESGDEVDVCEEVCETALHHHCGLPLSAICGTPELIYSKMFKEPKDAFFERDNTVCFYYGMELFTDSIPTLPFRIGLMWLTVEELSTMKLTPFTAWIARAMIDGECEDVFARVIEQDVEEKPESTDG